nr:immunoglobulin heavy chain junction region [Macaca mulatta]MOV48899.1 immunoglobulin heavy chain junction region [Macaca mulatta]MOV48990.1 immunoglobulin heavy chain junction region [Macaca mulatta]MOV49113.1 immunoglobulin heavy chain junction region [Macaca mulatta]MOV49116.1 immunoglobulin heavy chain junction region [Macaca mulatta]
CARSDYYGGGLGYW